METLLQDVRFGLRVLRKSPGFTTIAIITLALGIGANTALFSVINGVLLNPLPFPEPDQLVGIHESKPNFDRGSISYPNFRDWQAENRTFSKIAVSRPYSFSLTSMGDAEQVSAQFISSDFFSTLGVSPQIGRDFAAGEDEIGAAPIALISAGLWQRKFAASLDVPGKGLTLNGRPYTIVGVIPANFRLLGNVELFVPLGQWDNPLLRSRGAGLGFHGIGRLKPGVTIEQARADMERVSRNLAAAYPDADNGIGAALVPLKQQIVGEVRPLLLVLFGAVGCVLLIGCVNVANLMLEFIIRVALGAERARLMRQLLTESVLLAVVGAGLGLLLASWGTRAALGVLPSALPRAEEIGLDARVLIFTVGVSLIAGIFSGLAPALKTSRSNLHENLQEAGRGTGAGVRHRGLSAFVVLETAMALILLAGAGLMIRALAQLWRVNPGFDPNNVLTFGISLPPTMNGASAAAIRAAFRAVDEKFKAVPGVETVSMSWGASPLAYDDEWLFWLEGQPRPANQNDMGWTLDYVVEPDYFKAMRIPLNRGRLFTPDDNEHSPLVVVIDEVFAHKFFPNQDPVGRRIYLDNADGKLAQIIGVVPHVKQWGLDSDDTQSLRAQLYFPFMQLPDRAMATSASGLGVVLRSTGNVSGLLNSIQRANREMSSHQVIYSVQTMNEVVSITLAGRRFAMILLAVFAALALVLAGVGIYGVIAYVVGQRTQEIGIRMALGAQRGDVLRLILARGGKLTLIGVGVGLGAAVWLTRLMNSLLYGIRSTDPLTFVAVAIVLTAVGLGACYIPARRAANVDPMVALRYE